ncbi:dihydroneopterin aldolase [Polynucleobacter asymbioticus]|uniref:dihydroneopterin aldolase n=1 Tax=Polynucleobacter asymbioticus TaxID=576611 RepID=UPI001BFEC144|nr:dihydroneopterin aldolase [Polynucleobacter asymbioticus]QWD84983.1 dihydroneopterin aldolase [Polynucleobacter asymbioticus]
MPSSAFVELKDLVLSTQIGTYAPGAVVPDRHLLDLTLAIDPGLVLIEDDVMGNVFDYDPLVLQIDQLAQDGHYETQERLMTRIVEACAQYPQIQSLTMSLRKTPVRQGSGVLGIRLEIDAQTLDRMRPRI